MSTKRFSDIVSMPIVLILKVLTEAFQKSINFEIKIKKQLMSHREIYNILE